MTVQALKYLVLAEFMSRHKDCSNSHTGQCGPRAYQCPPPPPPPTPRPPPAPLHDGTTDYVPTRRASVRRVPIRRVHPDAVSVRRVPTRRVPFGRVSAQYPHISTLNYRLSLFCCYLDTSCKQDCYLLFVTLRFSAARRDGLTMFPRAKV